MNVQNDLLLLAYLARKIRLDQGLTLENLKDENISVGTISNIENMEGNPSESKVYYLFEMLGYDREGVEELKRRESLEMEILRRKLECVESMLDDKDLAQTKVLLNRYMPSEYHALYPYANYLKGLQAFAYNDIERAKKLWDKTIELCKKQILTAKQHLIAKCHNELSTCCYRKNNLQEAIYHVEKGLKQFKAEEQNEIKYALICNHIFYLYRSGFIKESYLLLKRIWSSIHQIQRMRVKLLLHKLHCILLMKNNELDEAERCCADSIEITQCNLSQKSLLLDFLNILGSIYLKQGMYEQALEYFYLALDMDAEQKSPRRHADTYTYLTSLYTMQNKWAKAQDCMKNALSVGRKIKDDFRLVKILIISGVCIKKQKQYDKAIIYFKEAVQLCDKHDYFKQKCTAVYELIGCFDKMDHRKEFSQWAEEFYFLQRKLGWRLEADLYDIF
ncbi:helix-turn-helix domain-containing protein [Shimazuella alba]|uniref:Tetratricopeptide repeat protein n=1 Tax=Shimazuella alba TaxID=2690964 RepID=A0A6I4VX02_9BACL|nr:helix-turn-helix transcriptional regulator [Shimazuella alba]MXQ54450.1 tetratricopeptide repeat protein [Shimazuella alba]